MEHKVFNQHLSTGREQNVQCFYPVTSLSVSSMKLDKHLLSIWRNSAQHEPHITSAVHKCPTSFNFNFYSYYFCIIFHIFPQLMLNLRAVVEGCETHTSAGLFLCVTASAQGQRMWVLFSFSTQLPSVRPSLSPPPLSAPAGHTTLTFVSHTY